MKQVIIMAAYYRVSTNLSVCVQCQVNFESTHHISSGNLKLMYFELFYARVLPHPTARTGCSFFTVTLDAAAQGIHCCLAIFFCHLSNFKQKPSTIAGRPKQITFSLSLSFWFRFRFGFSFPLPFAFSVTFSCSCYFSFSCSFSFWFWFPLWSEYQNKDLGHCGTVLWRCVFFRIGRSSDLRICRSFDGCSCVRSSIPFRESGARVLCPLVKLSIKVASFRRLPHVAAVGPRKDTTAPDEQEVQEAEKCNNSACARTRPDSSSDYDPTRLGWVLGVP